MLPLYDSWCALLVPFCRFHGHLQWTPVSLLRLFSTISSLLRVTFAMPILSQEDTNELDAGSTGQTSNASCQTPAAQQTYQRAIPRNLVNPNPPSSQNVQQTSTQRTPVKSNNDISAIGQMQSKFSFAFSSIYWYTAMMSTFTSSISLSLHLLRICALRTSLLETPVF